MLQFDLIEHERDDVSEYENLSIIPSFFFFFRSFDSVSIRFDFDFDSLFH